MSKRALVLSLMVLLAAVNASAATPVVYVNVNAAAGGDGTTWATAFKTLQVAVDTAAGLATASVPAQVWVAQGVYNETRPNQWGDGGTANALRGSLELKAYVELYGGFLGTETALSQRMVWDQNRVGGPRCRTIIDGSTARDGTNPAYHVMTIGNFGSPVYGARVDGFGITGGNASGVAPLFHSYRGGALYCWLSSPTIENCEFYANSAAVAGGAIANESGLVGTSNQYEASPIIENCIFWNNIARRTADYSTNGDGTTGNYIRGGGAIFNDKGNGNLGANPKINYCTFYGNALGAYTPPAPLRDANYSLAMLQYVSVPICTACIFYGDGSNSEIGNLSLIGGSTAALLATCDINQPGGSGGVLPTNYVTGNNFNSDPMYTATATGDFRPMAGSPVIDKYNGTNPGRDIRGVVRPYPAAFCDCGAFEYDGDLPVVNVRTATVTLVNGTASITTALINSGSSDAGCPGSLPPLYTLDKSTFTCADLLATLQGNPPAVNLTVTDYANNSSTKPSTVTVLGGDPYFMVADVTRILPAPPAPAKIYENNEVKFSVTACGGNGSQQFVWYHSYDGAATFPGAAWAALSEGASGHPHSAGTTVHMSTSTDGLTSFLDMQATKATAAGFYRCVETQSASPNAVSNSIQIEIRPPVSYTVDPITTSEIRTGSTAVFKINVTGGYAGDATGPYAVPYTFSWDREQSNVPGGWAAVPADGDYVRAPYAGVNVTTNFATTGTNGSTTLTISRALFGFDGNDSTDVDNFPAWRYRVHISDNSGLAAAGGTMTTNGTDMNLFIDNWVNIISQPQAAGKKYTGDVATFAVTVIGGSGPGNYGPAFWLLAGEPPAGSATWSTAGDVNTLTATLRLLDEGEVVCEVDDSGQTILSDGLASVEVRNPVTVALTSAPVVHRNTNGSVTFTAHPTGGYLPYSGSLWQYSPNGVDSWTVLADGVDPTLGEISGATTTTLTINPLSLTAEGYYHCVVSDSLVGTAEAGSGTIGASPAAQLTVTDALVVPAISISSPYAPAGQDVYAGDNFTLSLTGFAGGRAPFTYKWRLGGVDAPGVNDQATYDVVGAAAANGGVYTCTIGDMFPEDGTVTAPAFTVAVYADPSITTDLAATKTNNAGETATFSIVTAGGWPALHYQWQRDLHDGNGFVTLTDGGTISGATTATLTLNPVTALPVSDAGAYQCIVTDNSPAPGPKSVTSGTCEFTVTNNIHISVQPQSENLYVGDTATVSVVATAGDGDYHYAWTLNGANVGLADAATLTSPATQAYVGIPLHFQVTVTDGSGGLNASATSDVATVQIYNPLVINAQPVNLKMYKLSGLASFTFDVTGGIAPVTFEWSIYATVGGVPTWVPITAQLAGQYGITGYNTPTMTLPAVVSGMVKCTVVAGKSGDPASTEPWTFTSNAATLEVADTLVITPAADAKAYIAPNADASFTMHASWTGGMRPNGYVWKRRVGAGAYTDIPGSAVNTFPLGTSAALVVDPSAEAAPNVYEYLLSVTDEVRSTDSSTATVEFDHHLTITTEPEDVTVKPNDPATFSVAVDGGLGDVTIQWEKSDNSKAWASVGTGSTYTIAKALLTDSGSKYRAVITDYGSTVSGQADTVTSATVTLTVKSGVPAVGLLGLLALTGFTALGGAVSIRRRK